eukprot:TRINITY_DN1025_c0_g1_i13.p1 TRINITY_DN1025_c0_g1~~TRINITY_DN1025_c0_g1_i13.p1  ORF type:complete len:389 (-),score=100.83 TRINITY_DN1025_c0_g1_i13:396-1562(-)
MRKLIAAGVLCILFGFFSTGNCSVDDLLLTEGEAEILETKKYFQLVEKIEKNPSYVQVERWFDFQKLDHFNPSDSRTFRQRYWTMDLYWDRERGPVLFWLCGEYTCPGIRKTRLFPVLLAQRFNALIIVLEHRYYGASQPFEDWSLPNLKWLTVQQALDDTAYFVNFIKTNDEFHVGNDRPWIVIGGSYPGAMSAWYRYKYPHLTIGSLASSAVINAIADFTAFDEQIYYSTRISNLDCTTTIQNFTNDLDAIFANDTDKSQQIKASFGAEKLTDDEFFFYIADVFVETVQYGGRIALCNKITRKSFDSLLQLVKEIANSSNVFPPDYGSYYLSNTTYDIDKNGRQWTYQYCSQMGWFQTPSKDPNLRMRSTRLSLNFYKSKACFFSP